MPTTDIAASLDERIHDHRKALTVLMADTGRCDDIVSGVPVLGGSGLPIVDSGTGGTSSTAPDLSTGPGLETDPGAATGTVDELDRT